MVGVSGGIGRPVRAAVAAAVEHDHARVAGEVGDLALPPAGVDEGEAGDEEQRRLAFTVLLPEDAHAVAVRVPGAIRIARPRLLTRGAGGGHLGVSGDPLATG